MCLRSLQLCPNSLDGYIKEKLSQFARNPKTEKECWRFLHMVNNTFVHFNVQMYLISNTLYILK